MSTYCSLTGDRPSGRLHLGHFVGSLRQRLEMQNDPNCLKSFVMIADLQALSDHIDQPDFIANNIWEVLKDYLAVGLDPERTTMFVQSSVPELMELTFYFMNFVTLGRLQRNPTVKAEIQQKKFDEGLPVGFLTYPVSQAADITLFQADVVPVGADQKPMIEQTNEIVRRFNQMYHASVLKEVLPIFGHCKRLVGIDGKAKASKSLGNAIFLSDDAETVREKVFNMYTDPLHIRVSDPGRVEDHVVFAYLDAFDPHPEEIQALKIHYKKGGLGDVVLKKRLVGVLNEFLDPIRQRRAMLNSNLLRDVLLNGTRQAQSVAQQTIANVRDVLKINYFNLN